MNADHGHSSTCSGLELGQQYMASYHYAVITITSVLMDIYPQDTAERVFTVSRLFVGIVIGHSLVSSISARTMEANASRQVQYQALWCFGSKGESQSRPPDTHANNGGQDDLSAVRPVMFGR